MDPDGRTLFAGGHGTVSAVDPKTGERRWQRDVFGVVTDFAVGVRQLLVATEAGEVYSLSLADGSGYWRRKFPGSIGALATMYGSFGGAGTFVSVFGGPIFALNSGRTGATVWKADVWSSDSFVVAGRTLFAAGGHLVALDIASGEKRWTGGRTTQCGPAGASETVYAASESHVTAYEFDGGIGVGGFRLSPKRWSYPVEGRPEQGLTVADDAVFFLTEGREDSSKAYALEETSTNEDRDRTG
jgi:outer membrane protein assembly factor BamB